ncbi:DUF2971 domain-containing protein [Reyranella sp. MMS21-HV4-11]|uniref:DUF2971 domain-containing protein n=1 Tax=Reyranella humidisoli TaxID=2849149 RepID=A0ABS6IJG8_9HYPH|nr:DUF2971 domain-containing protein [Reyranella sp. MMS21-HV4-11]MBU8874747.1 DUF2971 domain-containing protein [Reyranella sp. MMS21-HV4-11]
MNDVLEVQFGLECLAQAYRGEHGNNLQSFLNSIYPGISKKIEEKFNADQKRLLYDTYITCLSEHAGPNHQYEDRIGRLSMWRAYGRGNGVALVINQDHLWGNFDSLGIFSSPVAYLDAKEFGHELFELAASLRSNAEFVRSIGEEQTLNAVIHAFSVAAVSTKHPGFREEREWRVIRLPTSPFPCPLNKPIKVIDGVPQEIIELPLADDPARNVEGLEPSKLLDRVIIGPTEFPIPMYGAFLRTMGNAGIPHHWDKLHISYVPLRPTSQPS